MSMTSSEIKQSTALFEIKPGKWVTHSTLFKMLPDITTTLFFAKVYDLNYHQLSELLWLRWKTPVVEALLGGDHSLDLQGYLVDTIPPDVWPEDDVDFVDEPVHAEVLPEIWASLEVDVATSIKQVADKLVGTLDRLPGKQGEMLFNHMAKMNKQRGSIGDFRARIHHAPVASNLVILDVSGSMTSGTVEAIIEDVVGLAWKADAHLAIVSNTAFHWEPGGFSVKDVLARAEYGGTQYEMLTPLLRRNWGTVITIADYDSSQSAKEYIRDHATGSVDTVLDISLVNRPTFLSECVGQLANEIRPLLIGNSRYVLQ